MRWFAWIVAGCSSPAGPVLETTTDGGSWTVSLLDAPAEAGVQSLTVELAPATGTIASVVASMPDMGHASDASIGELGGGAFDLELDLVMAGWWVLDGTVTADDHTESFRLELEVP